MISVDERTPLRTAHTEPSRACPMRLASETTPRKSGRAHRRADCPTAVASYVPGDARGHSRILVKARLISA